MGSKTSRKNRKKDRHVEKSMGMLSEKGDEIGGFALAGAPSCFTAPATITPP